MKKIYTIFSAIMLSASMTFSQWSEQSSGVTTTLDSVWPIDNNIVWVSGANGKVLLTTNGGTTWSIIPSPNISLSLENIYGIDANTALVSGNDTSTYVYKTTNAGASWTQVFTQFSGVINSIGGFVNFDPNYCGMIGDPVGSRWSIWNSTNGGSTWDSTLNYVPQYEYEDGWPNALCSAGDPMGRPFIWFGTNSSRIYRCMVKQNQFTWTLQNAAGMINIASILFSDTLHGIAGGASGLAYTSNGGTNWVVNTNTNGVGNITGIALKSSEIWYARGTTLWYTSNNGSNWTNYTRTGTYYHLSMARSTNNFNIWAVGSGGLISKYTYPIGIIKISNQIPSAFSLLQNYPNPFNPKTIINFQLPTSNYVKLIVCDATGREIATLVDEHLNPGTYEVEWNADNYSSGIYFYRIITENIKETKKMILVK